MEQTETKAIRAFYRKSDGEVVWYHELRGLTHVTKTAEDFPATIEQDLTEIPDKVISREFDTEGNVTSETKVGGTIEDYDCLEEQDPQRVSDFLNSDDNKMVDGELIIGAKRISTPPAPKRDLEAEIDALKAKVVKLESKQ